LNEEGIGQLVAQAGAKGSTHALSETVRIAMPTADPLEPLNYCAHAIEDLRLTV
jgi:hypothetical protein